MRSDGRPFPVSPRSVPRPAGASRRGRSLPYVFYGLGLAVLVFFCLWVAQGILVPLTVSIFLSFLIVSVKKSIDRVPVVGPLLPDGVSFVLSFVFLAGIITVVSLIVRENVVAVIAKSPDYQARLVEIIEDLVAWADRTRFIPAEVVDPIVDFMEGLRRGVALEDTEMPGAAAPDDTVMRETFRAVRAVIGTATSVAGSLFGAVVTIFLYTAFLLVERGRLAKKLTLAAGSDRAKERLDGILDDIARLVRTYISMKTLINLTVATISFLIMTALGTDFAGFWALLIFVFGFVPIVGAVIAVTLPTLLALVQPDGGWTKALLTLVLLTGAEQSISSFVEPRLMGRSLNLSPLVILLSLATWGAVWGFPGLLVSVPLTVVVLIVLSQFEVTRPIAILLSDRGEIAPIGPAHGPKAMAAPASGREPL